MTCFICDLSSLRRVIYDVSSVSKKVSVRLSMQILIDRFVFLHFVHSLWFLTRGWLWFSMQSWLMFSDEKFAGFNNEKFAGAEDDNDDDDEDNPSLLYIFTQGRAYLSRAGKSNFLAD